MTQATTLTSYPTVANPKVLSYGGGLDSFAMLLKGIELGDLPDICCFIDTGNSNDRSVPGEWPGTYSHIEEVVKPLCEEHGIEWVTLGSDNYPVRKGRVDEAPSLFEYFTRSLTIPVCGPKRHCTRIAKVERFELWLKDRFGNQQVEVWIGFEAGEEDRVNKDPNAGNPSAQRVNRFPLVEWDLCRCRCEALVRDAGYPVPRKSACVFCPYGSKGDWQTYAKQLPKSFAIVAKLESDKPPTQKNGIKLSIMGFSSDKLSASQAKALTALNADSSTKVHKGTRKALRTRDLITDDGELTEAGQKARKGGKGYVVGHKAPPLPVYIGGTYKGQKNPCEVCGAEDRATKATGCDWLSGNEKAAA